MLLWANVKKFLSCSVSLIVAAIAIWFGAKRVAKAEEKVKQSEEKVKQAEKIAVSEIVKQKAENEREAESIKNANEILQNNSVVGGTDIERKLRDKWQRD